MFRVLGVYNFDTSMKTFYEVENTSFSVWLCFKKNRGYYLDTSGFFTDSTLEHRKKWIIGPLGQARRILDSY